jgi:hypothetical protein
LTVYNWSNKYAPHTHTHREGEREERERREREREREREKEREIYRERLQVHLFNASRGREGAQNAFRISPPTSAEKYHRRTLRYELAEVGGRMSDGTYLTGWFFALSSPTP